MSSVTRKKSPNVYKSYPKSDFTRKMIYFNTFIARSGHSGLVTPGLECALSTNLELLVRSWIFYKDGHWNRYYLGWRLKRKTQLILK